MRRAKTPGAKRRRNGNKSRRRNNTVNRNPVTLVNKSKFPMPERYKTVLSYWKQSNLNNAGFQYANYSLQPANTYDVGRTGGATSIPYYSELGAIYRFSRLLSVTMRAEFANKEAFPLLSYITFSNQDPGTVNNSATNYLAQKWTKSRPLGPLTGNGTSRIRYHMDGAEFTGASWRGQVDYYVCSTGSSNASNNWYVVVGVEQQGGVGLVSGCDITIWLDMELEFFELGSPASFNFVRPKALKWDPVRGIAVPADDDSVKVEDVTEVNEDPLIALTNQLHALEEKIIALAKKPANQLDE